MRDNASNKTLLCAPYKVGHLNMIYQHRGSRRV